MTGPGVMELTQVGPVGSTAGAQFPALNQLSSIAPVQMLCADTDAVVARIARADTDKWSFQRLTDTRTLPDDIAARGNIVKVGESASPHGVKTRVKPARNRDQLLSGRAVPSGGVRSRIRSWSCRWSRVPVLS